MKITSAVAVTIAVSLALLASTPAWAEVNAAQAKALMKANKCGRCHAPNKTKSGPSLKDIAADLKDKDDPEQYIIPQLTTGRSEENTSELQSLMRISYAFFCLKKNKLPNKQHQ